MSLTKLVNGKPVTMSDGEAANIQNEWNANPPTVPPDVRGFEADIYATFNNDFSRINAVLLAFPVFAQLQTSLRDANWAAASGIIVAARAAEAITAPEYAALKTAATTHNVPLTLP